MRVLYEPYTFTLAAGAQFPMTGNFRYFMLSVATNPAKVSAAAGNRRSGVGGHFSPLVQSLKVGPMEDVDTIIIQNDDVAPNTITVIVGEADIAFAGNNMNTQPGAPGQKTSANSQGVVLASDQSPVPVKLDDGAGTSITVGQKAMAASLPVVLASDQAAVPVTDTGNVAAGAADSGNPVKVGGKYNTNPPQLAAGQRGDLAIDATGAPVFGNSNKPTFNTTAIGIAPTAAAWNALTVEQPAGATKTIIIKRIHVVNGVFTAVQLTTLSLVRTTAAATGGDGAAPIRRHDTGDTATAVGRLGAAVSAAITGGTVDDVFAMQSPTAAAANIQGVPVFDLTNGGTCKGFVIPKTNLAGVALQINGAAGGTGFALRVEWTEE